MLDGEPFHVNGEVLRVNGRVFHVNGKAFHVVFFPIATRLVLWARTLEWLP